MGACCCSAASSAAPRRVISARFQKNNMHSTDWRFSVDALQFSRDLGVALDLCKKGLPARRLARGRFGEHRGERRYGLAPPALKRCVAVSSIAVDFRAPLTEWRTWFLMANQDVQLRYKRSLIGPFWISLTLLAMVLGIGALYSLIFKQDFVSFLGFFAAGILAWNFISSLLLEGCGAVTEAESHLRSVPIRTTVLAARSVYRNLVVFLHNAVVVVLLLLFLGHSFSWVSLLAIPAVVVYMLIGFFWSVALAPVCARFRDIPQVISSLLQVLFFLTPIMWKPEFIEGRPFITDANPFFHLLELMRAPLLGKAPEPMNWIVSLGILAGLAILAVVLNGYTRKRIFIWL